MKFSYRLPPCSSNNTAATQSWIEDMAAKGYHLYPECFVLGVFIFAKGEPKQIRCRLEATGTWDGIYARHRTPKEEELALFRELGWEWMGRRGQFQIYITDDPNAPELHTDPRVQAISIQALIRHQRNALGGTLIWLLLYLLLFIGFGLAWLAAYLSTPFLLLLAGLLCAGPLYELGNMLRFHRLQKQLEASIPPVQHGDYRRTRWFSYLSPLLSAALYTVLLLCILGDLDNRTVSRAAWPEPLPFPVVSDLFPDTAWEADENADAELSAWSNLLTLQNYIYHEYRSILPEGTGFYANINLSYHDCRWEWFAELLAKGYIEQVDGDNLLERLLSDDPEITVLDIPGADYAVSYLDGHANLILRKGTTVIHVRFNPTISGAYPPEKLAALLVSGKEAIP